MTRQRMRILIAPDKFKGALNAREVAESIAAGLREVLPAAEIDIAPMADGGEGTAEVISDALGGSWLKCKAHDPLGREIEAHYAWIDDHPPSPRLRRDTGKLAVMEMSEARDKSSLDLAAAPPPTEGSAWPAPSGFSFLRTRNN